MARFAAALSQHPSPAEAIGEVVGEVLERTQDGPVDLAVLFVSPHYVGAMDDLAGAVRGLLRPAALVGCTTMGVIGAGREVEDGPGISLLVADFDGEAPQPVALQMLSTPDGPTVVGWPDERRGDTLLLMADPFSFPTDAFLERLNAEAPGLQVIGGLASAARGPGGNRLVIDDRTVSEGAVGVFLGDAITVRTVVSQGCRPVGRPYVVTHAQRNVLHELGGRPAVERLQEMVGALSAEERELLGNGVHIGRVVDERRPEFERGDFLIRNVVGVDRESGAVAVGDFLEVGQTVQFHIRDAESADEDLRELLAGVEADAALLFTCNGRGRHMFEEPDHDAGVVERLLGPLPLAGMFCGGELGPVGGRNFLHGFTASLALLSLS